MAETEDSSSPKCDWRAGCSGSTEDRVDLDVSWIRSPDLSTIDVLTRLHLIACHRDRALWLHGATTELVGLLEFVGLDQTLHLCPCG